MKASQADANNAVPVRTMCRVLGISASGYYDWVKRVPGRRDRQSQALAQRILQVHADSRCSYGMPRVHAQLRREGIFVSRKRVAKLMRWQGLSGISRRRTYVTTTNRSAWQPPARDLVNRHFNAQRTDQLWFADMTYVPTKEEGHFYLATVLDACSRKVVGWSMKDQMTGDLVAQALEMALHTRGPQSVIHHSDQGAQYSSREFLECCREQGVTLSMGSAGDAYDNATAESFFATFKNELVKLSRWSTRREARTAIFEWIEGWYNRRRLHSALGYRSPLEYEQWLTEHGLSTAPAGPSQAPSAAVDNPAPERLSEGALG